MAKPSKTDVLEAQTSLRAQLYSGQRIYCILRHASASGMSRVIELMTLEVSDAGTVSPRTISRRAAIATMNRFDDKREGVVMKGCGMDMGFALVDDLSRSIGLTGDLALQHVWL